MGKYTETGKNANDGFKLKTGRNFVILAVCANVVIFANYCI